MSYLVYGKLLLGAVSLRSGAGEIATAARGGLKAAAVGPADVFVDAMLALAAALRMYSREVNTRLPPAESPAVAAAQQQIRPDTTYNETCDRGGRSVLLQVFKP